MFNRGRCFSVREISPAESNRIILLLLILLVFSLLNIYFNPMKLIFRDILSVETINGCPLLTFAGIACPSCGLGRSFSCLTDLDLRGSIYRNPLSPVFFLISGFIYLVIFILALFRKKAVLSENLRRYWYIPVIFILVMWILNIFYGHHQ
jgi:hypothetical protein